MHDNLRTDLGLTTHFPAPDFYDVEKKAYMPCAAGTKENGGIFYHANTWAIIAETLLGRKEYAFEYYRAALPCRRNEISDICAIEPYVYASHIFGKQHPRFGAGTNSWLTGTAAWMFLAASQYIIGVRPEYDGLIIDPCIPASWGEVKVERDFRGVRFEICIQGIGGNDNKVKYLMVDGNRVEGNKIPISYIEGKKTISVHAKV